jgi:ABC-type antimicrobial peptide transport system permease subunit
LETVWLAPSAVDTFPQRLHRAGVTILATSSAAEQTAIYQRQGPALAILLFLAGAALGALLAAGGVVLNLHLAGRRRTYELAAMTALGVGRRRLLLSLFAEQALLLVFGIGVGVVGGIVGAVLALPAVPEFADTPTAPPMLYGVHLTPVLAVAATAVVVLGAVITLSAANLLRGSRFTQLREAPT